MVYNTAMKMTGIGPIIVILSLAAAISPALGDDEPQAVTNYSWLQLPESEVTVSVQGGSNPNAYGDYHWVRWGQWLWIPSGDFTLNGTGDYSVVLSFALPRLIESVEGEFWANEGTALSGFHIDGSNDGTNWTSMGVASFATVSNSVDFIRSLDVTNGTWQHVRMRFAVGEYQYGNPGRGGPGVMVFQPFGSGLVDLDKINWSHKDSFGTTVSVTNTFDYGGLGFNDGNMDQGDGGRCGDAGNWEPGEWARVDLKKKRDIDRLVIDWNDGWAATNYNIQWSNDGTNFTDVTVKSNVVYFGTAARATWFEMERARYWQVVNMTTPYPYAIMQQLMLYGRRRPPGTVIMIR